MPLTVRLSSSTAPQLDCTCRYGKSSHHLTLQLASKLVEVFLCVEVIDTLPVTSVSSITSAPSVRPSSRPTVVSIRRLTLSKVPRSSAGGYKRSNETKPSEAELEAPTNAAKSCIWRFLLRAISRTPATVSCVPSADLVVEVPARSREPSRRLVGMALSLDGMNAEEGHESGWQEQWSNLGGAANQKGRFAAAATADGENVANLNDIQQQRSI